eukprot:8356332-Heterocapsa_arctica.AAC.1
MAVKTMVPGYPYLQLMYNGVLLEDAHPLDAYNVPDGAVLQFYNTEHPVTVYVNFEDPSNQECEMVTFPIT